MLVSGCIGSQFSVKQTNGNTELDGTCRVVDSGGVLRGHPLTGPVGSLGGTWLPNISGAISWRLEPWPRSHLGPRLACVLLGQSEATLIPPFLLQKIAFMVALGLVTTEHLEGKGGCWPGRAGASGGSSWCGETWSGVAGWCLPGSCVSQGALQGWVTAARDRRDREALQLSVLWGCADPLSWAISCFHEGDLWVPSPPWGPHGKVTGISCPSSSVPD